MFVVELITSIFITYLADDVTDRSSWVFPYNNVACQISLAEITSNTQLSLHCDANLQFALRTYVDLRNTNRWTLASQ